jgi:osmotically-inducible protein OsmY
MNLPNPIRSLARRRRRKRDVAKEHAPKALLIAAGAAIASVGRIFDKRRRHAARERAASPMRSGAAAATATAKASHGANVARGAAHEAQPAEEREYDDVTLARKVESEIFRPADAPKGDVDVNVHDGIVELRGTVDSDEQSAELAAAAEKVDGVDEVKNLLKVDGAGES